MHSRCRPFVRLVSTGSREPEPQRARPSRSLSPPSTKHRAGGWRVAPQTRRLLCLAEPASSPSPCSIGRGSGRSGQGREAASAASEPLTRSRPYPRSCGGDGRAIRSSATVIVCSCTTAAAGKCAQPTGPRRSRVDLKSEKRWGAPLTARVKPLVHPQILRKTHS